MQSIVLEQPALGLLEQSNQYLTCLGQQPLNCHNLATHTTALQQTVIGANSSLRLQQPPMTICGKRTRSNSNVSSASSSSPSSHASVFSSDRDGYESQSSIELTPATRISVAGSPEDRLEKLAPWKTSLAESTIHLPTGKKAKGLDGTAKLVAAVPEAAATATASGTVPQAVATDRPSLSSSSLVAPNSASSTCSSTITASPECKTIFVDNLVDATVRTLDSIWKSPAGLPLYDFSESDTGLPLQVFVRETLRRGRTSCSTLQTALLYCVRLGQAVTKAKAPVLTASTLAEAPLSLTDSVESKSTADREEAKLARCPRRMFLAAIMIASKFVQDRTYSNKAWSKISGLAVKDLGRIERAFLAMIDYHLVVSEQEWDNWVCHLKTIACQTAKQNSTADVCSSLIQLGRHADSGSMPTSCRNGLLRAASDNVTGCALALDTEARAASSPLASNSVHCRNTAGVGSDEVVAVVMSLRNSCSKDVPLPYPMSASIRAAEI